MSTSQPCTLSGPWLPPPSQHSELPKSLPIVMPPEHTSIHRHACPRTDSKEGMRVLFSSVQGPRSTLAGLHLQARGARGAGPARPLLWLQGPHLQVALLWPGLPDSGSGSHPNLPPWTLSPHDLLASPCRKQLAHGERHYDSVAISSPIHTLRHSFQSPLHCPQTPRICYEYSRNPELTCHPPSNQAAWAGGACSMGKTA